MCIYIIYIITVTYHSYPHKIPLISTCSPAPRHSRAAAVIGAQRRHGWPWRSMGSDRSHPKFTETWGFCPSNIAILQRKTWI